MLMMYEVSVIVPRENALAGSFRWITAPFAGWSVVWSNTEQVFVLTILGDRTVLRNAITNVASAEVWLIFGSTFVAIATCDTIMTSWNANTFLGSILIKLRAHVSFVAGKFSLSFNMFTVAIWRWIASFVGEVWRNNRILINSKRIVSGQGVACISNTEITWFLCLNFNGSLLSDTISSVLRSCFLLIWNSLTDTDVTLDVEMPELDSLLTWFVSGVFGWLASSFSLLSHTGIRGCCELKSLTSLKVQIRSQSLIVSEEDRAQGTDWIGIWTKTRTVRMVITYSITETTTPMTTITITTGKRSSVRAKFEVATKW
jgi:hypothetical protein